MVSSGRRHYSEDEERPSRQEMKKYAVGDCTAVIRLYLRMERMASITVDTHKAPTTKNSKTSATNGSPAIGEDERAVAEGQQVNAQLTSLEWTTAEKIEHLDLLIN